MMNILFFLCDLMKYEVCEHCSQNKNPANVRLFKVYKFVQKLQLFWYFTIGFSIMNESFLVSDKLQGFLR